MEFVDVPRRQTACKPESLFRDEKSLYVQPPRARPSLYDKPYKQPTIKIDYDTTYGRSYMPHDRDPRSKVIHYGMHEKVAAVKKGKFDFDTTYKLSYWGIDKPVRSKIFVPRSCLCIDGSHDMRTTHELSYVDPGYSRAKICEPYRGKVCRKVPMDSKTVTKESYQDFGGFVKVGRPTKRGAWRTKFVNDYGTVTRLSYQYSGPVSTRTQKVHCRPRVTAKIDNDTVYNTSYRVPGRFVDRENVCA